MSLKAARELPLPKIFNSFSANDTIFIHLRAIEKLVFPHRWVWFSQICFNIILHEGSVNVEGSQNYPNIWASLSENAPCVICS